MRPGQAVVVVVQTVASKTIQAIWISEKGRTAKRPKLYLSAARCRLEAAIVDIECVKCGVVNGGKTHVHCLSWANPLLIHFNG